MPVARLPQLSLSLVSENSIPRLLPFLLFSRPLFFPSLSALSTSLAVVCALKPSVSRSNFLLHTASLYTPSAILSLSTSIPHPFSFNCLSSLHPTSAGYTALQTWASQDAIRPSGSLASSSSSWPSTTPLQALAEIGFQPPLGLLGITWTALRLRS